MALRSIHTLIDYCEQAKLYAKPGAPIFNFTNPSGLVTQALRTMGYSNVYGVCDAPSGFLRQLREMTGYKDMSFKCFGIATVIDSLTAIKKFVFDRYASVKEVKAKIVDKYKPDIVSKYPGTFKSECYVVVFETKNKKLSFNVSEFSYGNYKINEKGTLKYKGSKIISFS